MDIDAANQEGLRRILGAQPVVVDVLPAAQVLPRLGPTTVLHAGPPLGWVEMCGPMQGAVMGALRYQGLASGEAEGLTLIEAGGVVFDPCHHHDAVGPMTGMITPKMPVFVVENRAFGNRAYCTINEGLGKVMRFGANDDSVIEHLRWLEREFAPALGAAVRAAGGIPLKPLMAQALQMGDEMHQRNVAASSLFARQVAPRLARLDLPREALGRCLDFLTGNDQFFLNLAMAAGKATLDPARNIPGSTLVTAMSRNGTTFGIRVSGLGDRWFVAPVNMPEGLYFPGFGPADANPDMGDSAIVETMGLGGFAMAASPAVVKFLGAGTLRDARRFTEEMQEITLGPNPAFPLPTMDDAGIPTGIDIRKVVETGILPAINTGIAHKKPGVGQVGAGVVRAPLDCFVKALEAFTEQLQG
jgi:uncharacterized protein DUF1116